MSKTITFEHGGTEYTLEYTRRTVTEMEKKGFVISAVSEKPMSTLPELFAGAFLAHHRGIKRETVDKIFEDIPDKEEFVGKLAEMYVEPLEALMEEPKQEGNASWKANW